MNYDKARKISHDFINEYYPNLDMADFFEYSSILTEALSQDDFDLGDIAKSIIEYEGANAFDTQYDSMKENIILIFQDLIKQHD